MNDNSKGMQVLMMVICVATLVVAAAGATFAYFSAGMNEGVSNVIEVNNGKLVVSGDNKISGGSVATGEVVGTLNFTLSGEINGSSNLNYETILNVTNNTYADGALTYTLTSNNDNSNGTIIPSTTQAVTIPTGANAISVGKGTFAGPITTGATHTYTLTVTYVGTANPDGVFEASLQTK